VEKNGHAQNLKEQQAVRWGADREAFIWLVALLPPCPSLDDREAVDLEASTGTKKAL
jgi:hypothetical protein